MANARISFVHDWGDPRIGNDSEDQTSPQGYAKHSEELIDVSSGRHDGTTDTSQSEEPTQTAVPTWFNSGFRPLAPRTEVHGYSNLEVDRHAQSAQRAPEVHVLENSTQIMPQFDEDGTVRERLLRNYTLDDIQPSRLETGGHSGKFKMTGSQVLVKRASKDDATAIDALQREVDVLSRLSGPSILKVLESLESDVATWAVLEFAPGVTLRQYIDSTGPQSAEMLKSYTTQLLGGIASIFNSGFAHLRLCDKTILISTGGRVIIHGFEFAYPYGNEKIDGIYSAVDAKCGDDIYVAPEVFASIEYNGRKAAIWSAGVVLYFMTTGTTAPLSVLNHPAFDTTNASSNDAFADPAPAASRRKLSTASQQALKVPLIAYPVPGGRLSVPSWTRDIISKMLQVTPLRRPELIEVAAKVPKEYAGKETRPLMEVAWQDYKNHVGPLAGLNDGEQDSERNSLFSFSGMSAFSRESLGALIPGRRRNTVAKGSGEPAELGTGGSHRRRRSLWS